MQVNQEALAEIAADKDIGLEAWRVFAYLNARLDFDNLIAVQQTEIATALGMKPPAISRAIRLLTGKRIILRGPKLSGLSSFKLNEHYGWKGSVENLARVREARLRVIGREAGPDALGELENTP